MPLPSPAPLRRLAPALALAAALLVAPGAVRADVQDEILQQTAEIRGLGPKAEVPFAFAQPDQIRADLLRSFEDETSVREMENSRKLLVLLGLLSPDADLHGMLIDLYAENIQGYYNRVDKKMYVVAGSETFGPSEKTTLAHEYTHALQDQHFDLERIRQAGEANGDRSLATTALIEGDATLTMVLYARTHLTVFELLELQLSGQVSTLDQAPLVIRDEVVFPYNEGALFAFELYERGGFEALNAAFRDPPTSSEQILHPEKYLNREPPIEVSLPNLAAALGPGWSLLRSDVLGELDYRILLQQFLDQGTAARGAAGWAGDRFALLENAAGDQALVLSALWDSEAEAEEFTAEYVKLVARRYGRRAAPTEESAARRSWATPNGPLLLERQGKATTVVMAPTERVLGALAAAMSPGAPAPTQPGSPRPSPAQLPR